MVASWGEDPRIPFAFAVLLGMIAGVAAKQAVALSVGNYPRPLSIVADFLVLGMVFLIVMYVHSARPSIPVEGIALISAALAMWGPRGIAALLNRFKRGALFAADTATQAMLEPIEAISKPIASGAGAREREEAVTREDFSGRTAPIRKLRDVEPVQPELPSDQVALLGKLDQAAPDYKPPRGGIPTKGNDHE